MEIKDILKNRRIELGLTQLDVAKAVGVSEATVSRWESGDIANMRRSRIAALAGVLQISPTIIMGWDEEEPQPEDFPSNILPMPAMRKIPLVGTIACGTPILAEQNIECDVDIPEHIHADFALRCKGDSMINARIYDGDIVYIRSQPKVENGEIAAVEIDGEGTLKRVYIFPDQVVLQAENPRYEPHVYKGEQLADLRILGKAVGFTAQIQ